MDFPALFQDRTALVLGLGDSGLAMAAWAARLGARVTVWDSREQPPQLATLRERLPQADFIHGALSTEAVGALLDAQSLVLKSPGLSPLDERLKPVYDGAAALGLRVQGELDLFAQALSELKQLYRYAPGVLAITGTNGKTTTTSMTALLAERAGRRVAMAGNIGPTLLGTLADALDREPQPEQPSEDAVQGDATESATDPAADHAAEAASPTTAPTASGDSATSIDPSEQAPIDEVVQYSDTAVATEAPSATSADAANTSGSETPGAVDLQSAALRIDSASQASVAVPAPVQPDGAADAGMDATAAEPAPSADAPAERANASAENVEAPASSVHAPAAAEPDTRNVLDTVAELLDEAPLPIKPPPPRAPDFDVLPQVWVLELSSFQLDGVVGFEPSAAAVLNITQDHLDWHGDMPSYARAKGRIFGEQAVMVINRDDPEVEALVPAPVQVKQGRGRPSKTVERQVVRFGLDAPRRPGDFGLVVENGMAWLVRARELEEGVKRRKGEDEEPISLQRLMPADALRGARPSQRCQCAGGPGAGQQHRLPAGADAARAA